MFICDQIKEDYIGRACRRHVIIRTAWKILVGKPERRKPLERPGRLWENNIKMDLK
jgi:hypothetical protein